MTVATPNLRDVLAAVVPGRVVRLQLTREQKQALRDPDAQLALDVVRHLLDARADSVDGRPPERFPLTEATFQAVACKLGRDVGTKRCRRLLRRLRETGVLEPAGSYRQPYRVLTPSGFRVALYRLRAALRPAAKSKRPVGTRRRCQAPREAPLVAAPVVR